VQDNCGDRTGTNDEGTRVGFGIFSKDEMFQLLVEGGAGMNQNKWSDCRGGKSSAEGIPPAQILWWEGRAKM
jgi:hypothetical protein